MKAILKHRILTLLLSVLVVSGWADTIVTPSGHVLNYVIYGSKATITQSAVKGNLVIPDTIYVSGKAYPIDSIGIGAFRSSSIANLSSVIIPNTVKYIGASAFYSNESLSSVIMSNSTISIGNLAFSGCRKLNSITLPDSLEDIGDYAFIGCNLTKIIIPDKVKIIGREAFYNRDSCIYELTIGASVEEIGINAFSDCISLKKIVSKVLKAPWIDTYRMASNTMINFPFVRCKSSTLIYVPCSSLNSYLIRWGYFEYIIPDSSYEVSVMTEDTNKGQAEILIPYNCDNSQMVIYAQANNGYSFTHWSDGSRNMVRTVLVTQDTSITAYFSQNNQQYNIIVNSTDGGTVSGSGKYSLNQQITITASANQGYKFVQWQDGNTQTNRVITVTSDSTFTAYFQAVQGDEYTIIARSIDNTMGVVYGGGSYSKNATTTIMAAPNTGYEFVQWQDGDKNDVRTITVTADSTFTAYFRASTGVEEANRQDINVYAADNIIVVQGAENEKVSVYDITGRVLYSTTCAGTEYKVNVSANGIYIVRIGNKCVKKVVVINQ